MPVSFNQIANNTATVTLPVKNLGTVTIEYYPNKLTSKYVADLQAGKCYVNIHSAANKGGELRGQLVP